LTSTDDKYGFGWVTYLAWADPVAWAKHARPVVVMMAVKHFEPLKALAMASALSTIPRTKE
jgi:hypothetical protein